jgi:DNA-binding transcriptional regulator YiaG
MPKTANKKPSTADSFEAVKTKASELRTKLASLKEETGPLTEQQKLRALRFDQKLRQLENGFYALVGDLVPSAKARIEGRHNRLKIVEKSNATRKARVIKRRADLKELWSADKALHPRDLQDTRIERMRNKFGVSRATIERDLTALSLTKKKTPA